VSPGPASPLAADRSGPRRLATSHSVPQGLVGAATTLAATLVAAAHRSNPALATALAVLVVWYGVLSAIDLAEQRLPNQLTLPLAALTALTIGLDGLADRELGSAVGDLAVGLAFGAVLLVFRFGMGDVKLALTVGTVASWLGHGAVLATVTVGSLAGGAIALVLVISYRRWDLTFGFGPVLAIGSVAGMLAASPSSW
jgi:leader peptidase (prepilin peptidase)/N-methyltransferase